MLGSTQPDERADPVRAGESGIALARRRTGGGAVYVDVADPVWIDVWLPAGDPLVTSDVGAREVVMGVPARVVRRVPDEDLIERWR